MRHPILRGGHGRQPRSTSGATDLALVKLVLAGAPSRWLWVQPQVSDFAGAPDWQALERAIGEHHRRTIGLTAQRTQSQPRRFHASEIWHELGRLWREFVRRWKA